MGILIMKDDRKETIIRAYHKFFTIQGVNCTRESLLDPHAFRPLFKAEFVKDTVEAGTLTKSEAEETFDTNFVWHG